MKKIYKYYKIVVIIFTLITFLLCFIKERSHGYSYIYLIPFCYLFLFVSNKHLHVLSKKNMGMFLLNVAMFYKYILTSFLVITSEDFALPSAYRNYIDASSNKIAIFLILGEMISIFLLIFFTAPKFYANKKYNENQVTEFKKIKPNVIMIIVLIFGAVFMVMNIDKYMPSKLLYVNSEFEVERSTGFETIVSNAFKVILTALLINKLIVKYQTSHKKIYMALSYICILMLCLLNTGSSRTMMMVPLLLFIIITINIFKKKDSILFLAIVVMVLSINLTAVSMHKFAWKYKDNNDFAISNIVDTGDSLQEYTSFIRPVAAAIETNKSLKRNVGLKTIVNDTLGSIPILNHFVDKNARYNIYYNYYIFNYEGKVTKIAPLLGYSLSYFGYLGFFILTDLCVIILMIVDSKIDYKKNNFLSSYNNFYLLFVLSQSICCSYQSIIGRVFVYFMPVFLIDNAKVLFYKFNKKSADELNVDISNANIAIKE